MKIWAKIKPWLRGKRLVGLMALVLVVLITWGVIQSKNDTSHILTDTVKKQDLKQTVLATGEVTSSTDLNLSFRANGPVRSINVKVGDKVATGRILATLDQKDQLAQLTTARGSLAAAQANYQKILDGASSEDVALAQQAVDAAQTNLQNTKSQQQVLVQNAQASMLNAGLAATASPGNLSSMTATISGTYNSSQTGNYEIEIYLTGNGYYYRISGLESGSGPATKGTPLALGTRGLYITFSSSYNFDSNDSWTVSIPNTQSSTYLSAYNSYQAALQTQASAVASAEASLSQAQATLNLKKAQARPADLQAAQAQILSAQGQVQAANASLENTIVRAPAAGTITKIDIKLGQLVSAFEPAIVLQNVDQLYLEANISEANVAMIETGQSVEVTFDALGPDTKYTAAVANLDLSSTVVSGVVNYKLTAALDNVENIRPGMTANMSVKTGEKSQVLAVPLRSVIDHSGKKYVRVITDSQKKSFIETEVTVGFQADGGLVEITSGLSEGAEIVAFIESK